jgi:hypothetical protein
MCPLFLAEWATLGDLRCASRICAALRGAGEAKTLAEMGEIGKDEGCKDD